MDLESFLKNPNMEEIFLKYKNAFDAINNSFDAFVNTDLECNIQSANLKAVEMLGSKTEEALIGTNIGEYIPNKKLFRESLDKLFSEGSFEGDGTLIVRMDGSTFVPRYKVWLRKNLSGENVGISGTIEDVTEKKGLESEVRLLENFFKYSIAPKGIADINGNIILVNSSLSILLKDNEMVGNNILDYYHKKNYGKLIKKILPKVKSGGSWMGELYLLDKKGNSIPTLQQLFLIKDNVTKKEYLANTILDLSNRLKIQSNYRELQAYKTLRDVLLNFIGDAYRNRLTPVLGKLDLARMNLDVNQEKAKEFLSGSRSSLYNLIEGLQYFVEVSSVKKNEVSSDEKVNLKNILNPSLNKEPIYNYCGTVLEIPDEVNVVYNSKKGITYDELPLVVGKEKYLKAAIKEIIINAIESYNTLDDKPKDIQIYAYQKSYGLVLKVQDWGNGIEKCNLKKVSFPFYKILCTKVSNRYGLGLYVAHKYIRACGGNLEIKSKPTKGTTASIFLKTK